MSKNKEITIITLNGINFGCFTNNLAAFNKMKSLMLNANDAYIPSYSTINRAVTKSGELLHITSLLGQFVIKKHHLLRKAV